MKKYFLFPGDFTIYNMAALFLDNKNNNFCWEISKSMDIDPGDIAYLYFHDITGEDEGRILLKTEIKEVHRNDGTRKDVDCYVNFKKIKVVGYKESVNTSEKAYTYSKLKEYGITVNQTKTLIGLDDDLKLFDNNELNKINVPRIRDKETNASAKKRYLKNLTLLKDLENSVSFNSDISLETLKEYFDKPCEACSSIKNNRTFKKLNGLMYYEIHHFVMQNVLYETKKGKDLKNKIKNIIDKTGFEIYSNYNTIHLCPVCHREIHYGTLDVRKDKLNKIFESKKTELKKVLNKNDLKELLFNTYKLYDVELTLDELENLVN